MKLLITYILTIQNNTELLQSAQTDHNLSKLISVLTLGIVTILALLILNLIKVYKQKNRIKSLEEQLNNFQ